MRKVVAVLALGIVSVFAFAGFAQAADKFAAVDLIRVASEYNKFKDYNKLLDDKAKAYEGDIDKKISEFKALQDKVSLLSDKEKETKRSELETKYKALEDFKNEKENELRKKDFDNRKEVAEDIRGVIKQFAEKDGFTFIFDDRMLAYQPKGVEITDKIIEILNKGYVKK
ncbi:MAG: OmpH family outer membrane protein [Candidatus Omnitrophica bacterium]|nr:OmpH family outer membrane protein [Candidatus Omnitrophota bacterium]